MSASRSACRRGVRLVRLVGVIGVIGVLVASLVAPAGAAETTSYSHRIAQGRFFLEQGMYARALEEFEAAARMPLGQGEAEVHELVARTAYRSGDVGKAVDSIRTAEALTNGSMPAERAELYEFLTTRFGKVLVIGAGSDNANRPEPSVPLLDPELKRVFEAALAGLDGPRSSGSTSIWLPVGNYRVGGLLVEVSAEGTARMDLRASVGHAGSGVYGERDGGGDGGVEPRRKPPRVRPDRPRPEPASLPPVDLDPRFAIRLGGLGFSQQGNASGGGRLLLMWEGHLSIPLTLRVGGEVAVTRIERIQADRPAPPGVLPALHISAGPRLRVGPAYLLPSLGFVVGYAAAIEPALPEGYAGPIHYLQGGADLDLTIGLPATQTAGGTLVRPTLSFRMLVRETRPLAVPDEHDPRPHLSVGGGADLGLSIGHAP